MIPSPDKREQCSTFSSVIAIKVTIPWTLLIRIDIKTMSHWERCFNIAWSFFLYISIYFILKLYVHVIRVDQNWHGSECRTMAGPHRAFNIGLMYMLLIPLPARLGDGGHGTLHRTSQPECLESGLWKYVFSLPFVSLLVADIPCSPLVKAQWQFSALPAPFCPLELQHTLHKTGLLL